MALRFANKIHCIVNNVVAQGLRIQAQALKASTTSPPKTRYPLNQQDANSYIEQLKARAFFRQAVDPNEPDVVRTFNVNVHCRGKPRDSQQSPANAGTSQRCFSSKAADSEGEGKQDFRKTSKCSEGDGKKAKMVQCKPGRADPEKCKKMPQDDTCPTFKLKNCEKSKDFNCNTRKFIFKDCTKMPAPYPAFSEACYEPLPPSVNECKDCPWSPDYNHPTFKPPMNKHSGTGGKQAKKGQQKRKFHSDARKMVTLRFGEPIRSEKDRRQEELEKKLYAELNKCVFEAKCDRAHRLPQDAMSRVSPYRSNQIGDMFRQLAKLKHLAEAPAPVNRQRWDMLLKGPGFRHQLGKPGTHRMRRRKRTCITRCPTFKYKYVDYDIKKKQRQYRKHNVRKQPPECDCAGSEVTSKNVMELAPRGRNMDQHKDMPKGKQQPLGARRHRMRRKKMPKCGKCEKFSYRPPIIYDIKKKQRNLKKKRRDKKRKGTSSCTLCIANTNKIAQVNCGEATVGAGTKMAINEPVVEIFNNNAMWCRKVPKKHSKNTESLECEELAPSLVCPEKSLLDRKPYPKYRKATEKRLKKEKALEEKRRAARWAKKEAEKKGKRSPKKKAAGLGTEEAVEYLDPVMYLPIRASTNPQSQKQPHAIRPAYLLRKRLAQLYVSSPRIATTVQMEPPPKFDFKPLPLGQSTPPVAFRTEVDEEQALQAQIAAEEAQLEKTINKLENMILAKNRVRVTGPPQCGNKVCDEGAIKKKKCPKKIKSKVCPVDLLDRKPYKKFREGQKKRNKKHHKHHGHHKHGHHKHGKRHHKHHHKHHKHHHHKHHKHAAGAEQLDNSQMMNAMVMDMTARHVGQHPSL